MHLGIELTSCNFIYVESTTEVKVYHVNTSTGTETQLDVDPGDASGDGKSRVQKIKSLYHDRDNQVIWGVDCDNDGVSNIVYVWKLDYSSSETSPTVTEVDSHTGGDDFIMAGDIFIIGANTYGIWGEYVAADNSTTVYVYDVDSSPFVLKDSVSWGECRSDNLYVCLSIVVGTKCYFIIDPEDCNNLAIVEYDSVTETITYLHAISSATPNSRPSRNQQGISYDGSNIIYGILNKDSDSLDYLFAYSISGNSDTIISAYNIALMLDRNTNTNTLDSNNAYRPECFRLEKGFDISEMKIYQIPRSYTGTLNYIANALRTQPSNTIVAITDSYLIVNNNGTYELWEFVDLIALGQIYDIDIIHPEREYPDCTLLWRKTQTNDTNKYFDPPGQDQLLQVYGTYTSTNGVADIVSDESLYLLYRGAHNFSGITTAANYYKGSGGLNYETVGTSGTSIAWIDSATLYDGACEIVESIGDHYNVIRLTDDATAGEDPRISHSFSSYNKDNSFEMWIRTNETNQIWRFIIKDSGTRLLRIQINNDKIYYEAGGGYIEFANVTSDIWYHIRIVTRNDDNFDIYLNGTKEVDDIALENGMTNGITYIELISYGDSINCFYIDAPGLVGETDPQSYVYEESWNTLDGDIDELLDEGYTIEGALGGSYIRVGDVGGHEDVLDIYDNEGGIDIYVRPIFGIPTAVYGTQTYGTVEFWLRTDDATYVNLIELYDGSTSLIRLRIDADKFQYYEDAWYDVGLAASDDIWYHIRIAFECTSGSYESLSQYDWKIWINGTEYGDYDMANNQPNSDNIGFRTTGADSNYHMYIDAVDFSWSTNYRRNRNAALSLDDQIIFEGLTKSHDKNIETEIECLSKSKELDNIFPKVSSYTNYTGKTSGQIVDQLIDDFCNYILPGTISNGSNTFTCPDDLEFKGDKSLRTIINELADGEQFTWGLRPTGELDFDDGSVNSYVSLDSNDNKKLNPRVEVLSEDYNQVIIYGGYVDGSKVGPYTYDNESSQQLHGIITWTKTYANQFDATILQTLANNKGAIQGAAPLIYETDLDIDDDNEYGFIQPHETVYLSEGLIVSLGSDETLTEDEAGSYILAVNEYDGIMQDSRLKMTDGLLFIESAQTTLSQQNSQLIEQLGNETQMVAYPDASVSQGDHNAEGIKSTFTAGENVVFGDFCYFKSDGKMWKSDADAAATMPIVAMAIETITADNTGLFLLTGIARDDTWNWGTIGGLLYGSCTTGEVSQSAPVGSGDQVQLVGWAITADIIYFKPDFELTAIP